jgi:hypothetical protein
MHWPEAWEPDSGMPGKPDDTVTIHQTWYDPSTLTHEPYTLM